MTLGGARNTRFRYRQESSYRLSYGAAGRLIVQRVGNANPDFHVVRAGRAGSARAIVVGGSAPAQGRARTTGGVHHLHLTVQLRACVSAFADPDGVASRRLLTGRTTPNVLDQLARISQGRVEDAPAAPRY